MIEIKTKIIKSDKFVIAEIGMNHDGSLGNAIRLIEEAHNSGVDAVKFQLHFSEYETLPNAPTPPYFKIEGRFDYFKRTSFTIKEWKKLKNYSQDLGLYFIVSPFSHKAVDILEEVDIDAYKIASGETTNIPLLEYINSKKKPVLLSTGMSDWKEIDCAIKSLKDSISVLFQCSSEYPCKPESVGLNVIPKMISKYPNLNIGFSDHTLTNSSSIAALLKGAKVFEKHFTLSKKMYGADARFSMEPFEMKKYIEGLTLISLSLRNPVNKNDLEKYQKMKIVFEKSIVAHSNLEKGKILEFSDLDFKKPGDGIRADRYKKILNMKLVKNLKKDEKITFKDIT